MSLNGFIIDVFCVSESNLEVEVDASKVEWGAYQSLIRDLEDLLNKIDEEHSARSWLIKGRSLRARYRRVDAEDRSRKLRFSPFPGKFYNILKNTRTYIYELVAQNCLVLERIRTRKVYMLPKHLAPFFVEAIEKINSEVIDPLRKGIEEWKSGPEFLGIVQTLYKYKVDTEPLTTADFSIGNFVVDVLPVDFGYSIDKDDAFAKMNRAENLRALSILDKQIERRNREYALNAISDVTSRIVALSVAADQSKRVRNSQVHIDRLIEICDSLKLTSVNDMVLKPLKEIFEADVYKRKKLSEKYFGIDSIEQGVRNTLKGLLQSFAQ